VTCLDLRPRDEAGSAAYMRPGARRFHPRFRGQAVGHRSVHQLVPCGVVVDLVDPGTLRRIRMQDRGIAVRLVPPCLRLDSAGEVTQRLEPGPILLIAPALYSLA